MDCYRTTLDQEGVPGLYKGFGALVLQFAAHIAVIKVVRVLLIEVGNLLTGGNYPKSPPPTEQEYVNYEKFGPNYAYSERPDISDNSYSAASVPSTRSVSPVMRTPRYRGEEPYNSPYYN